MRNVLATITLIGLVIVAGCSSDSPSAHPAPTVVPDSWAIPGLAASDASPYVGSVVLVTATVTRNGSPAPDGTVVEFLTDAGFISGGTEAQVITENGSAHVFVASSAAGTITVQARVHTISRQVHVTYINRGIDDTLEIYQPLMPNEGSYEGGEQVFLNGKGIIAPVEVSFVVQGTSYPAIIQNVVESVPASATGTITIRTPYISNANRLQATAATVVVRASLNGAPESVTLSGAFTFLAEEALQIYQPFVPRTGVYDGGDLVTIRGRAIKQPVSVVFRVQSTDYEGLVQSVVESNPPSAEGRIVVETPFISAADRGAESAANVTVRVAIDTPQAETEVVPSAFIFYDPVDPTPEVPYWRIHESQALQLYLVLPDYGASAGGNTATLLGSGFLAEKIDTDGVTILETRSAIQSVTFGQFEAQVVPGSVTSDGTQVQVVVPRLSVTPITTNQPVSVELVTALPDSPDITNTRTRPDAYIYLADEPQPTIASISPNAGPLDGGTPVTILGSGFQTPVQVTFGALTATEVVVIDDQTLADNDEIRCLSPDYSQQGATPPTSVGVTVTNMQTGNSAIAPTQFTYGDNLFISGNSPSEGQRGDFVIIYGSGFEDPLRLFLLVNGETELDVTRVAGTEITAMIPNDVVTCGDLTGEFRVDLLESNNLSAQGGGFTLIGNNPRVLSVDPLFVQEIADGDGVTPSDVTITGQRFAPGAIVEIGPYRMPNTDISVVDETLIEVSNLPPPNLFNLTWDQVPCLTDEGISGLRRAATPVNVAVINIPGQCRDVLTGGLVYEPEAPECIAASSIQVQPRPVSFPATSFGTSSQVDVEISNIGAGDLIVQSVNTTGQAFSIAGNPGTPVTLGSFESMIVTVEFTPTADDGAQYTGNLGIVHTASNEGSPLVVQLTGQEAFPILSVEPGSVDFGTVASGATASRSVTVRNTGSADLNWTAAMILDPDSVFAIIGTSSGTLAPNEPTTVTVRYAPTANSGVGSAGTLRIDSTDSGVQGAPQDVQLTGSEGGVPDILTSPFGAGDIWTFPQTAAGVCSAAQNLTIENVGASNLTITSQSITTAYPTGTFTVAQPATSPVVPGASTTLSIQFCPVTDDGLTQTGSVTIASNDPDEPSITIDLEGPETP